MRMEMEDRQKARQEAERRWEENELVTSQEACQRLEPPLKAVDLHILLQKMGYLVKERGGWVATEKAAEMIYQEGIRSGIPGVLWRKEFFERLAKEIAIVREDG